MHEQSLFSCFIIGEGTLPIQCAEILISKGHEVRGMISGDDAVRHWACRRDIPAIDSSYDACMAFLGRQPFDYLFSIVHDRIIPPDILQLPRKSTINYHDACLPRYAGMNATSWALMRREKTHGVTWHVVTDRIDAGAILKQAVVPIAARETAFTLNAKCYEAAIRSFSSLADDLASGQVTEIAQNLNERTYFSRRERPSGGGMLSWSRCAEDLEALVRALDFGSYPNPLGLPKLAIGQDCILVMEMELLNTPSVAQPGTIVDIEQDHFRAATTSCDVALRRLATIDGRALSPYDVVLKYGLDTGHQLSDLDQEMTNRLDVLNQAVCGHEAFWIERLASLRPLTHPYSDRSGRSEPLDRRYIAFSIPPEVRSLAADRQDGWAFDSLLLAAFGAYLVRIGGMDCFDVGFNQVDQLPELGGLESFFAACVPLRVEASGQIGFSAFSRTISAGIELLGRYKTYARDVVARNPSLASIQELRLGRALPITVVSGAELCGHAIDSDLTLAIAKGSAECFWSYDPGAFSEDSMARILRQYQTVLLAIAADPQRPIGDLPLLDDQERREILVDFNATGRDYDASRCLHQLVEAQVERTPDNVAVISEGRELTYRELNDRANQLGRHLRSLGIGAGSLVAVYLTRSMEMVTALLGILKAGAAYIPLETSFPRARIEWILDSLDISVIVTQHPQLTLIGELGQLTTLEHVICLDAPRSSAAVESSEIEPAAASRRIWTLHDLSRLSRENLSLQASPDDLAYIIFTSGSTGTPKGVMVRHRPVINLLDWANRTFRLNAADRVLFITSLTFDLSVYDIFGLLSVGGSIRVASARDISDPERLLNVLCEEPITFWDSAPAALQQLAPFLASVRRQARTDRLRLIFLSGDWIPVALPDRIRATFPRAQVISLGGATEATVWSNYYPIGVVDPDWISIPYGKPIQNAQYYVLDSALRPCPIGIRGDLYIGGVCLASGYANEPRLTAEKFVPNPFLKDEGGRMKDEAGRFILHPSAFILYKTGDQARYWPDGNLEFLGRTDHQVKIRGFRIELGEIEAALNSHPALRESIVVAYQDGGEKRLVAYIVASQMPAPTTSELRHFLQERLPEYMVPSAFVALAALPMTSNGKVDRKALPAPDTVRPELAAAFVAPRTAVEGTLAAHWAEVLGIDCVGIYDNFFELGGHSLLASQLVARLRDAFQVEIALHSLFEAPTVAGLAEAIETIQWAIQSQPAPDSLLIAEEFVL